MQSETQHHILVVEDEALTARDLQCSLQQMGYGAPWTAATADEAIGLALDHKPDLVLMDIHLDGPSDGISAASVISSRLGVPIVFLTAYADLETVQRAKRVDPYGYLVKPIRLEELRIAVELAFHKHELERRLRERERWFSTTLHAIADAVISVDTSARVTFMNPAAEFMIGMQSKDALGRPVREVLQLTDAGHSPGDVLTSILETPLERALRTGRVIELPEAKLKNLTNGEQLVISDSAAQVVADGEVLGAVMVFRNITEQKELQTMLLISDRMASMGLLAAGVAHELNNPLSVVLGNAEACQASIERARSAGQHSGSATGAQLEMIEDIRSASIRMRDIVRDLALFSKSDMPEQCNVVLQDVMASSVRLAKSALHPGARIETHYGTVPLVFASESRLGQVFLNLLINASQAFSEDSKKAHCIRVELATNEDGAAVVEIADDGPGIPEATLKRLFTPFFTTKPVGSGTGLGLSICRRIVIGIGGTIDIKSQVDQGTTVRIVLPASDSDAVKRPSVRCPTPPARARIMLVDDDATVTRMLQRLLSPHHDVTAFSKARDALAHIARGNRYDVILCDLMMPELSGMDFHALLAADHPEQAARVVVLTGGGYTKKAAAFLERTGLRRLDKPLDFDALQRIIARMQC